MRIQERVARAVRVALAMTLALAVLPSLALASGGGLKPPAPAASEASSPPATETVIECSPQVGGVANGTCTRFPKARLFNGMALAPATAIGPVRATIEAANLIRTKPYIWGGGHGQWSSPGYDCSGAVSFALHGGGFVETPMDSGEMMDWGLPGKGRWITIYANAGHAFAVIDGLRWDTVGDAYGTGPRWHRQMVPTAGFVARHPPGY